MRLATDETLELLHKNHIPLVGIEAVNQLQYEPQQGFLEMAAKENYSVGRVYTIAKDELKKITPEEPHNVSILVILNEIFVSIYSLCMKLV